ncbi:MAG: hypothetical protein O3B13_23895 [Planctomycetota bacterium]|nr:hypothetical protein [Planctomycetota bacterium]
MLSVRVMLKTGVFAAVALLCVTADVAIAQKKAGPARLAADLVTLDSGERLRGALLGLDADGVVTMAIQREWLRKTHPQMLEEVAPNEIAVARESATQLRDRIQNWLDEKPESNALVTLLETELERAAAQLAKLDSEPGKDKRGKHVETQFVMLTFPRREVDYSFAQSAENRRIAMLSWRERFEDVETRTATDLEKQLRAQGIDPVVEVPNLADRIPARGQDEIEWSARRAIIEYELATRLDFQGMGKTLFRTDAGAEKAGLEKLLPELIPQLLQEQIGGQLADLLREPGSKGARRPQNSTPDFSSAIRETERVGARGFRVTTLDLSLQRKQARVETRFFAKLANGKWETIWSHVVSADTSKPRPDEQRQIENDPQISEALKLVKSLGLGVDDQLGVAMNFGAATMESQKAADQEFFRFLDDCVQRLDGPKLSWTTAK